MIVTNISISKDGKEWEPLKYDVNGALDSSLNNQSMTETQTILKPQDLRVGNWVNHETSGPFQWDWKDFEKYVKDKRDGYNLSHLGADAVVSDKIEPIELNPELLSKCEQLKLRDDVGAGELRNVNGRYLFGFVDNEYGFYENDALEIKYLHELQNLFFSLTKEELKVNL